MSYHILRPMRLERFLREQLRNGKDKLTYEEIAQGLFAVKRATDDLIDEIRRCWNVAEKRMRARDVCAMLVTDTYFENYSHREPRSSNAIAACIALEFRGAAGVRLLTHKGARNDPMAIAYFMIRTRNVHGAIAAVEDRATIEWAEGNMTKRIARRMIDNVVMPVLPLSREKFEELMRDES